MNKKKTFAILGKNLESAAIAQMEDAMSLNISMKGAIMPDAHLGYGLPIGGVLAVKNAVIPYAVGVDIACRMKLSVLNMDFNDYNKHKNIFKTALETKTKFGVGQEYKNQKKHQVLDEDWSFSKLVKSLKDMAAKQLGTSGSGNHFAEFVKIEIKKDDLGLKKKEYIGFLTHSGSRGTGAKIADHFSSLAKRIHPELGKPFNNLAWLGMDSEEGIEYFMAMELMGKYALANHEIIHNEVLNHIGEKAIYVIENHHNFAWKEKIGLQTAIVHRKGATPAHKGVLGIIPGSMADPGFIVKGLGNDKSINSAAHGAGRQMSRNAAIKKFSFKDLQSVLQKKKVDLISAGIDEIPMAYKNIEEIMAQQKELVKIVGKFEPFLVKMAPEKRRKRKRR